MENGSTPHHHRPTLRNDGSENRESPEARGANELREGEGILPGDVARRVFGPDPEGTARLEGRRSEIAKTQRELISAAGFLPLLRSPGRVDAKGTEHSVRFRGSTVEKHQHSDGWVPVLDSSGRLIIESALPKEYLRRLELQNELFGDLVRVVGLTQANRFVRSPSLQGGSSSQRVASGQDSGMSKRPGIVDRTSSIQKSEINNPQSSIHPSSFTVQRSMFDV